MRLLIIPYQVQDNLVPSSLRLSLAYSADVSKCGSVTPGDGRVKKTPLDGVCGVGLSIKLTGALMNDSNEGERGFLADLHSDSQRDI